MFCASDLAILVAFVMVGRCELSRLSEICGLVGQGVSLQLGAGDPCTLVTEYHKVSCVRLLVKSVAFRQVLTVFLSLQLPLCVYVVVVSQDARDGFIFMLES